MRRIARKLLLGCLRLLTKPLVRFCIRHSLKIQDVIECLKLEFIESAKAEIMSRSEKVTDSRLAVMTGLQRRDVVRIKLDKDSDSDGKDLISKIIGQWLGDKRFLTSRGKPRILSAGFEGCEFNKLVSAVSRDLNPATVLFELERVNSAEKTAQGVQLLTNTYLPEGDPLSAFKILSHDVSDLIATVESNSIKRPEILDHHLRTEYDNVRADALPEIKAWLLREGHDLHRRTRDFISKFDLDINPDLKAKAEGKRVVFSSFGKTEEE